jgi:transposase
MFIRTKKTPRSNSISIQLVESFRDSGKIKQRVVRHIGTTDNPDKLEELKKLAESIKTELFHEKLRQKNTPSSGHYAAAVGNFVETSGTLIHADYLEETQRLILGIHDIYGHVYDSLGFSNPFSRPARKIFAAKILREIVLARIACPKSKRASVELLEKQFGVNVDLDHVYQMMDKIDDRFCENIQKTALSTALKLTGEKLRVLFYDATTLYFESFIEDDLKRNGYSKDMKFNQSQVLLALFVTEKGLPIGYELFPGNTFEGHTLIPVLEKLKTRYQLDEVIFVADRGLLSEENLKILEERNFKYIVGARIKNVSKTLQESILNKENYRNIDIKWNPNKKQKEAPVQRIAKFDAKNGRQLIVHYHSGRAKKDAHDRSKSIEKLYKKLSKSKDPKTLLNNYGYKKYIDVNGEAALEINEAKIEEATQWDGLLGVVTNIDDHPAETLLMHYRGLWQIEESFRINKHDLRMRPIYHWSPHRVKAHIAISFIAFVCVRYLEYRMAVQSDKISPEEIRKALLQTQASIIHDKKSEQSFLLPSKVNPQAKEIYRVMRIKMPNKLTKLENRSA